MMIRGTINFPDTPVGDVLTDDGTFMSFADLGLEIGVDVQAWDTVLDDISAMVGTEGHGFAVRAFLNTDIHLTVDNSGSGTQSQALFSAQSDVSRIDMRSLSGGYTVTGDLVVGDCVIDATSRLVLNGGNSIVFTNDPTYTERMRLGAGLMVGTTTDPGDGVINVLTGFRIGNAAANNNILMGNGTDFVSTSPSSARTGLGLGTMAVQNAGAVSIAGGDIDSVELTNITFANDTTYNDGIDLIFGDTVGTKFGTSSSQKIGFFNAAPVTQRTSIGNIADGTGGTPGVSVSVAPGSDTIDLNDLLNSLATIVQRINRIDQVHIDLGFTN